MKPPPSCGDNRNAGHLLVEKRFSAISRGFQDASQIPYGFSSRATDWVRPGRLPAT